MVKNPVNLKYGHFPFPPSDFEREVEAGHAVATEVADFRNVGHSSIVPLITLMTSPTIRTRFC
jgi:hypothetical protein